MLGWRMGARVVVFGCCPHVAQHRRLQEYASLSGHERPGWCYPTGRCAYLPSVTCYRQSIKPPPPPPPPLPLSLSHSLTLSFSRNPIQGRKKRKRTSGRGASVYKLVFCYKVSIHVQFFDTLDSGGCAPFLLRILLPHKILCLHVS